MSKYNRKADPRPCSHCGTVFEPYVYQVQRGHGRYCTVSCSLKERGNGQTPDGFKEVPGYEGYLVDESGGIWSVRNRAYPKKLKPTLKEDGYLEVGLSKYKYSKVTIKAHLVVLLTWIGPRPEGMEACHNDGDKTNNNPSNLRWDTRRNNMQDAIKHGKILSRRGVDHPMARLTEEEVLEIRKLYAEGATQKELGFRYNVTSHAIYRIVKRKNWRHI